MHGGKGTTMVMDGNNALTNKQTEEILDRNLSLRQQNVVKATKLYLRKVCYHHHFQLRQDCPQSFFFCVCVLCLCVMNVEDEGCMMSKVLLCV